MHNIIKSTGFKTTGNTFIIETNFNDCHAQNGKYYKLIVCQTLPSMSKIVPVEVEFNKKNIPLLTRIGNTVMSDQLLCRKCHCVVYGDSAPHLIFLHCSRCTANYKDSHCQNEKETKTSGKP